MDRSGTFRPMSFRVNAGAFCGFESTHQRVAGLFDPCDFDNAGH
jgi:hypothetical protein